MNYFTNFKRINYRFGNETEVEAFQNISTYADVIDQIKDDVAFYNTFQIPEGMRPDQLSMKLYNTPVFHWTFYLLNDKLRLQGWPLTNRELEAKVKRDYPNTVITTRDSLVGKFKVGQTVVGSQSGVTGKILHRNVDIGQLTIESSSTLAFQISPSPEAVTSTFASPGGTTTETITITSFSAEHLGANHYIDGSSNRVDIDPAVGPGGLITEVTNFDNYINENEELKVINVIKPGLLNQIASSFTTSLKGI